MTNKEIAERLREFLKPTKHPVLAVAVKNLADELDPPKPRPGTVVWCRTNDGDHWELGIVTDTRKSVRDRYGLMSWEEIEWKPATVLKPGQLAVDIPPLDKWPVDATYVDLRLSWPEDPSEYAGVTILRTDAEKLES